ncbi:MAG TPA: 30S ribosome-binding factor RbfA [Anaerolineae bacterium]
MSKIRQQRTADQIQLILSDLFHRHLGDPRLQDLTITNVMIDRELEHADIYVNALGDESRQKEVMTALQKASGFLRHELSNRIRLRVVPQLHFHWDYSLAHTDEVNEILDSLYIPPEDTDKEGQD